ncbi:nuclear transport factor 2 family protein [Dyella sp. ASV21]|jgi:glyoxylase I family protein|uniref:nuclear transport factor 2 family protein n=1 Tax=Dyella sp. ASV21 TaxID=2795114 RepID=UPI0018EC8CEE|nr:nuclear transport factor 2 family protein [Dyella sp. ASV21]
MDLIAHLLDLETRLHQWQIRADEQALRQLLAEDFFELGVSGAVWTREAVIEALRGEAFSPREVSDFRVTRLADGVALATYRVHRHATPQRPAAASLRSSIWCHRDGRWQMQFHQGTPLPG